jgi:hypothetical protein
LDVAGAVTTMKKSYSHGGSRDESAARPEEVVALRRMSESSDEGELLSSFSDDELNDYQDEGFDKDGHTLAVDGGGGAWKALLAAWLVDFMTSGKCVYTQVKAIPSNASSVLECSLSIVYTSLSVSTYQSIRGMGVLWHLSVPLSQPPSLQLQHKYFHHWHAAERHIVGGNSLDKRPRHPLH